MEFLSNTGAWQPGDAISRRLIVCLCRLEGNEMVDFKKLMNHTPEEKALADKEIEKNRQDFLDSIKDDPSVKRMKRRMGEQ